MNSSDQEIISKLAKPGAGLPLFARLANRFFLKPFVMKKTTWAQSLKGIQKAHDKIKSEISGLTEEQLLKRVLVPPQVGLEDSSRYWSIAMTLRHISIVGGGARDILVGLTHGRTRNTVVSIKDVKPEEEKNQVSSVAEYTKLYDTMIAQIEGMVGDRNSKMTFLHPWFGQLNAKDWLWIMSIHSLLHLKQIRNIKSKIV